MFVKALNDHLIFPVKDPRAAKFFPGARAIQDKQGRHLCAVPHSLEAARLLVNKGVDAPSPIRFKYNWPGPFTPYPHQLLTSEFLTLNTRAFLLSGMGAMKTSASIWALDYLMREGDVTRCLICAPLSTLERVWGDELFRIIPRRSVAVLHGTREKRLELLKQKHDIYVINHDGLVIISEALADRPDINMILIDEAAVLRNASTKRWKIFNLVINKQHPRSCWGLTGTPTPRAPTDAYGQAKLIKPENYRGGFRSFQLDTMYQVNQFKWVPKRGAEQVVAQVLSPSIRYALEDCVSLPPTIRQERQCSLSKQQELHYKELMDEAVTIIGDSQITAVNAAVLVNKLVQASCIAGDTLTLTDSGWKKLIDVAYEDLLWDGVEWVHHDGLVYKGYKAVVSCFGVEMTDDHKVLTKKGWTTAKEVVYGYASEGFEREEVRIPHPFTCCGEYKTKEFDLDVPVRLRKSRRANRIKPIKNQQTKRKALRVQNKVSHNNPRENRGAAVSRLDRVAEEVPVQNRQRLEKLRRTGNLYLREVAALVRGFRDRYVGRIQGRFNSRKSGQQRPLLAGELPVGNAYRAGEQQTNEYTDTNTPRGDDGCAGSQSIQHESNYPTCPDLQIRVECREGAYRASKSRVYDVLNCGPRNRFTVASKDGTPLLVHNCGVMYGADKEVVKIDFGPRLTLLKDIIEECNEKVIVFVPLTGCLKAVAAELAKDYNVEMIYGGVAKGKRNRVFTAFQHSKDPRILVADAGTMAHGLNLTAATTIIWYAPINSNDIYTQANARIVRPGQKNVTNIVHMYATNAEAKIYKALAEQTRIQDTVLELVKERK